MRLQTDRQTAGKDLQGLDFRAAAGHGPAPAATNPIDDRNGCRA